jgi:two-component system response regulator PilR (NtrC family)
VGVIYADSSHVVPEVLASDHSILTAFSSLAAVAIANARRHGALETARNTLEEQNLSLHRQLGVQFSDSGMISQNKIMHEVFETVRRIAPHDINVLIHGASGTGKELLARAIHDKSPRREGPFVTVNCAAVPQGLVESVLFGHRKGSFTGAIRDKTGYFEAANGGTLFLDEISTLPLGIQSSLLRVLEDRQVTPVGDTRSKAVDVRVIAASNQDLERLVKDEQFREDLFFRLNVVTLRLPPLRERKGDIPLLVHHFIEKYTKEMSKAPFGVTNGAMRALLSHDWRGNVRELENVIERAVIFADGEEIGVSDLPFRADEIGDEVGEDLKEALRQFERQHIMYSLRRHDYDKTETARHLGIGLSSLYRKLDELSIAKNIGETEGAPAEA